MSEASRSPEDIERVASRQRSEVREMAEELKYRLSPETLVDNGLDYMRGTGGTRLAAAVRQNPLAALLAGIGIGWLYYTMQRQEQRTGLTAAEEYELDRELESELRASQASLASDRGSTVVRH